MGFEMPRVHVCCCGLSLKTGVYIIGLINVILLLILAVASIFFEVRNILNNGPISTVAFFEGDLITFDVGSRLTLAFCLLYGCYKNNPSYMLGFFLMQVVFILVFILFLLFNIFLHVVGLPQAGIFFYVTYTAIQGYSGVIVFNHYRNMKEAGGQTAF